MSTSDLRRRVSWKDFVCFCFILASQDTLLSEPVFMIRSRKPVVWEMKFDFHDCIAFAAKQNRVEDKLLRISVIYYRFLSLLWKNKLIRSLFVTINGQWQKLPSRTLSVSLISFQPWVTVYVEVSLDYDVGRRTFTVR